MENFEFFKNLFGHCEKNWNVCNFPELKAWEIDGVAIGPQ